MTTHQPQLPETPYTRFKRTYTPLYRTLLILGILAALLSLTNFGNVRSLLESFDTDVMYAVSGCITTLVLPALMIASLILLWHKHPTGIRLRLAGYATSVVASTLGLFTKPETLSTLTQSVIEASQRAGNTVISDELAASMTHTTFYGALYVSIGASLLFAFLWWKAWKHQSTINHTMTK